MTRPVVQLQELEPGAVFTLPGKRTFFELVEHGASSSSVRQAEHGEQIDFTRADGTPVGFEARRRPLERWSSGTRVVAF